MTVRTRLGANERTQLRTLLFASKASGRRRERLLRARLFSDGVQIRPSAGSTELGLESAGPVMVGEVWLDRLRSLPWELDMLHAWLSAGTSPSRSQPS